jgi:hypothetical protein
LAGRSPAPRELRIEPTALGSDGAVAEFVDVRARIHLGQRPGQEDGPVDDGVTTRSINSSPLNVLPGQVANSAASVRRSRRQSDPSAEGPPNVLKILFSAWRDR